MNKTNKNKSVLLSENENMKKEKIKDESTKEIKKVLRLKGKNQISRNKNMKSY